MIKIEIKDDGGRREELLVITIESGRVATDWAKKGASFRELKLIEAELDYTRNTINDIIGQVYMAKNEAFLKERK